MRSDSFDAQVAGIAALGEPARRSLYRYVAGEPGPVSREQAARGVGVPLHVAKFHLDRLERDGLLDVEFSRPPGRSGPGAGRPAKLYRRSDRELRVSLPERRYDLAGMIMAGAITSALSGEVAVEEALRDAAVSAGRALGQGARARAGIGADHQGLLAAARAVIDDYGYESRSAGDRVTFANCPFHALADAYRDLVCGMNLDLVRGVIEGLDSTGLEARLDPAPSRCCVTISVG